jgi:opacity protein-like surface antigen
MHLKRVKPAAMIAAAVMASLIALASPAQAASSPATASQQPDSVGDTCAYAVGNLHYAYWEPEADSSLAWSSEGAASGNAVMLGNVKSSSPLDCFKEQYFGNGQIAFEDYLASLCLNVAGNSHAAGAWIILYACGNYPNNERFSENPTSNGIELQSITSGLCIDVANGYKAYSIIEQEPCGGLYDVSQQWNPVS